MPIHYSVASQDLKITYLLLAKNKEIINQLTSQKTSPLHLAVTSGNYQMVLLLLKFGANISIINNIGHSPFHLSMICPHINIPRALLVFGSKIDEKDNKGRLPIDLAILRKNENLINFLNNKKIQLPTKEEILSEFIEINLINIKKNYN